MALDQTQAMLDAFLEGEAWARSLKPGDVFRGSHGEASHRGYVDPIRASFGAGALTVISGFKRLYLNRDLTIADNSEL